MQVSRVHITDFLKEAKGHLVLDVRSPAEYEHAHIPGAISLPLFSNEERKIVGTAYKQESREKAIKIGLDIFGPKDAVDGGRCGKINGQSTTGNRSKVQFPVRLLLAGWHAQRRCFLAAEFIRI